MLERASPSFFRLDLRNELRSLLVTIRPFEAPSSKGNKKCSSERPSGRHWPLRLVAERVRCAREAVEGKWSFQLQELPDRVIVVVQAVFVLFFKTI